MGQRIAKVVDEQREKRRKSSGDGEIPESPTQALVRAAFELRRSVILAQNELLQSKYHQQLRGYGNQLEGIPSTEANTFFTAKLAAYDEKRGDTPMKYDPVRIVYVIYDVTEVFTYYMWVDRNEQLRHVEAARRKMVFNVDVIGPFKGDFQEIPWQGRNRQGRENQDWEDFSRYMEAQ
ncbi:hypothetical protein BCR34DRAFT_603264 [Clohesyomyces aquaticus]|uniref:Uncharacterized protein n=1 Tax=Clohesyomyces aquaticus TaxID=1231657 RepID=A0A1Y1ZEZ0_9PLEO|nr:hypothetical protein BCR34DRAFT_603264 [Clohesyomyces aquaticus]